MHFALIALLFLASVAAGQNLVHNGDFEIDSPAAPPAGWAMWGPEGSKVPALYRRDADRPHGGKAALRIEHPANSAGYLSAHPQHFIAARAGMTYELTFWARADRAGTGVAGVGSYTRVDPLTDAPGPGSWPIELTTEWKAFRFKLVEGLDFDAADSPLLQLYFKPTKDEKTARVMWLDDVSVTAAPNPAGQPRVIALGKAPYTPVDHVLTPGDRLAVTIDAAKPLREANRFAAGVSFHKVQGHPQVPYNHAGAYTLPEPVKDAVAELKLPMTRFYAIGSDPLGPEKTIDHAAELCKAAGIPLDRVVLELEDEYAHKRIALDIWAKAVKYSVDKGYGFRHWEIGNEVYGVIWGNATAYPTPDDYIDHVLAVSKAIRGVQKDARIGVSIRHEQLKWGSYVLARTAGSYDFVCPHLYGLDDARSRSFEQIVLDLNGRLLDEAARLKGLIKVYNPGRTVTILDTEWGLHSIPPGKPADEEVRNGNIVGVLHRAVRLIYCTREPLVEGASAWVMFGEIKQPGFGLLPVDAPRRRTMLYWLYRQFIAHTGDRVLAMHGTAPFSGKMPTTPLLATTSGDQINVVIANGSWSKAVPAELTIEGFPVKAAEVIALSQDDLDAPALLADDRDPTTRLATKLDVNRISFTLPPHAVVFVRLRR